MSDTTSTYIGSYHETWDEFVAAWEKIDPRKKAIIVRDERDTAGTLSVIVSAQRTYVNARSKADYSLRRSREAAAAVEAARMTVRNPDARRQRVLTSALEALGPARLTTRTEAEKATARRESKLFFKSVNWGWKKKRIMLERDSHYPTWLALHPTEIPTTAADLEAWEELRVQVRHLTGCPPVRFAPKEGFIPVGSMTRERALQIALAAIEGAGR